MNHLISVGGGFSSTIELPLYVQRNLYKSGDRLILFIAALRGESPDLWKLVGECERLTGVNVICISWTKQKRWIYYGCQRNYWIDAPEWAWSDIWDIFNTIGMMGNSLADPCSRVLKRETITDYICDHYPANNSTLYVGITRNEIDRMLAIRRRWTQAGYRVEAPLCDVNLQGTSGERCEAMLGWTPRLYLEQHSHNNCNGFCVKAGHAQMARLLWYDRNTYRYHEERELAFQISHNTFSTIMRDRKTINGVAATIPLTLRNFRLRMETKWIGLLPGFDPFDGLDKTPGCSFCESVA
jgi:hypothetical protein